MSVFILVFLSVYTAMHALVFFRIRVLLADQGLAQGLLALFMAFMIAAPIGARVWEKSGHESLAQVTALIGFSWMGFVFLAFWMSLLMGILDFLSKGIAASTRFTPPSLAGKVPVLMMLGFVAVVWTYGYFDARNLRIERVRIETSKLPEGTDHLKIAQISDVHLGLIVRYERLSSITDKIISENPDILVSTGDFVDGFIGHLPELKDSLRQLRPRYGKYAVTGNHEAYAGLEHALEFTRKTHFTLLRGEVKTIPGLINIVGVDDAAVDRSVQEGPLLSSVQNGLFTLFLKHRPKVEKESLGLFDLQLSGHTHGGQIFPFRYIVALQYPLLNGYYELDKGSRLYTSRGTGTWGPPIRVLSPPEVTIIELVRTS